jgi:glycosyltransferase involved in cell wall biosynthesis
MTGPITDIQGNRAWTSGAQAVRLSILIPFHRDDPTGQIATLMQDAPAGVELIAFDDGKPDAALNAAVSEQISRLDAPAALITARMNRGRAAARNHLARAARGSWVLYLDADMAPTPGFLARWLDLIEGAAADALFGGYTPVDPDATTRVHARLATMSDDPSAARRTAIGPTAVCSSNLAVRRQVLSETPFDEDYEGWGWEDVDWALSAAERFELGHVDNPAAHAGLETVPALMAKFSRSGANFARLLRRHPAYARRPGARLALTLSRWRLGALARLIGAALARAPLPAKLRALGLKLFRSGICAKALAS